MPVETNRSPLYMGVDGGGTNVRAVVVDAAGKEVGRGNAGSANHTGVGVEEAVANIWQAAREAAQRAGTELPVRVAIFGLAGVDRPADQVMLGPLLAGIAAEVILTNDAELCLEALTGGVGICLISGTGSIALGRDALGNRGRAGGWGHIFGDEGSGYDIGRHALQAIAQAADGRGQETSLTAAIFAAWGLEQVEDLFGRVYPDVRKGLLAELSEQVFTQAAAGDSISMQIVAVAAQDLATTVLAAAEQLEFDGDLPLALTGGVLRHQPMLREEVLERVGVWRPVGQVVIVDDAALQAARSLARRHVEAL